jgi:cytidylate kinase
MKMETNSQTKIYQPGYYGKKRPAAAEWADMYIRKYSKEEMDKKQIDKKADFLPAVCISRQIGVGALEIADLLSEIIHHRVIDREILEHMAKDTKLSQKMIEFYDERYPGRSSELFSMLISEKTFIKSDYGRQLIKTVTALACSEPTIFVGRGAHLILPRNTILSVRFICSRDFRVDRLARMMNIGKSEAERQLEVFDAEQHQFFKAVYQKKETTLDEFDLIINMDHIKGPYQAAVIVACAFEQKFGLKK